MRSNKNKRGANNSGSTVNSNNNNTNTTTITTRNSNSTNSKSSSNSNTTARSNTINTNNITPSSSSSQGTRPSRTATPARGRNSALSVLGRLNKLQKWLIVATMIVLFGIIVVYGAQKLAAPKKAVADSGVSESMHMTAEELDQLKGELTFDLDEELISKAFPDISWEYLDSSLPNRNSDRVEAAGFSTALTFPFSDVSQEDGQQYSEEQISNWWINQLPEEILRNVVYGPAVAKALSELKLPDGTTLADLNPWLGDFIERYDSSFGEDGYGNSVFLEKGSDGVIRVTSEYRHYATGICWLLERFTKNRVDRLYSKRHWGLPPANDLRPTQVRAEAFEEEENRDSLIVSLTDKSGNDITVIGFNVHDKRPMIPSPAPKPEPEPEQTTAAETTPQETPAPVPSRPTPAPRKETPGQTKSPRPNPKPEPTKPKPTPAPQPTKPVPTKPQPTPVPTRPTPEPTTPAPTQPTPAPTKPEPTTPAETGKERNHAPINNNGATKGNSPETTGTTAYEPVNPKHETGKGHGDPVKETPTTPTQRPEHTNATVKQVDQNTMNYQTQPARTNSYKDTNGSSATVGVNHDAPPNGEFTPED